MPDVRLPSIPDTFKLTPEFRLIVACSWIAPPHLEQEQAGKIASLCEEGINWQEFLMLVRRHGVPSLAYTMLCRHAGERFPEDVRNSLKGNHIQAAGQALFQTAELLRLIGLFSSRGMNLIPLKGVFLSHQLYGDVGLRSSCDLDILVRLEQLDAVCQLVEEEGYVCNLLGKQLTSRQRAYLKVNFHHLEYRHVERNICLEVHWRLGSLWQPDQMALLWNNVRQIEWMGSQIDCLDEDYLLLFLCDHGARHGFDSLKWLGDIARIVTSVEGRIQGNQLELAECLDLERTLGHAVLLVNWFYGIPLSRALAELVCKDNKVGSISRNVYNLLHLNAVQNDINGKPQGSLKLALQKLQLRRSLSIRKILKPKMIAVFDFLDFPLPDSLFWLYYPMRPVTLVWRHFLKK